MRLDLKAVLSIAALTILTGLAAACGGGGGGGGGGGPVVPQPSLVFTPAGGGQNGISLATGPGSTVTTLLLEVRATGVTNLYGVAFDLRYPSNLLRYDGVAEGTFLSGSASTSLLVAPSGDTLVVGHSRLGAVGGISGSGVLFTLRFTAIAPGGGTFGFSRNSAAAPDGSTQSSVTWSAGSVQVVM